MQDTACFSGPVNVPVDFCFRGADHEVVADRMYPYGQTHG
jgi:hypothetical protein